MRCWPGGIAPVASRSPLRPTESCAAACEQSARWTWLAGARYHGWSLDRILILKTRYRELFVLFHLRDCKICCHSARLAQHGANHDIARCPYCCDPRHRLRGGCNLVAPGRMGVICWSMTRQGGIGFPRSATGEWHGLHENRIRGLGRRVVGACRDRCDCGHRRLSAYRRTSFPVGEER